MPRWLVPAVGAAVAAPLLAAALAQRGSAWHPVFDLAMTELRVRDVGGADSPLIGLQGRIGPSGSHPGPISFYLLAPVYRLFGSSSFALQMSTVVFHAAAGLLALFVAGRRRDARTVVGVGVVLLLLVQGYGLGPLAEPWNPHLPVLWFVAFLVAGWAVVDGDLPMLVPAVLAASVCAQTHVPYLAVTVGLGAGLALAAVAWARTRRATPNHDLRWVLAALGVGVLLWTPPLVDEVTNEPGNLTKIVDHLGTPADEPIGIRAAGDLVLERLDGWLLVVGETRHPGTYMQVLSGPGPERGRGVVTLVIWLGCVVGAVRLRHQRLLALHAVIAASALIAVIAISRIYGVPWPYLMFWAFGIGALMVLSIAGTVVALLARRDGSGEPLVRALTVGGLVVIAGLSVRLLLLAPDATTDTPDQTQQLARLMPSTLEALAAGRGAASGQDGRYLVTWDDPANGGSEGIGMVNELIRRGYDVGVEAREEVRVGPHRVRPAAEATAHVVLAGGGGIDRWGTIPGAVRVAFDDPRTDDERAEFASTRAAAIDALERLGRDDLVGLVDTDLFGLALNQGLPGEVNVLLGRLLDIGGPVAVYVVPPEAGR